MIGIKFYKAIRPLILAILKIRRYVKIFKVKVIDKVKNNKLMSFCIDEEKLLEKHKAIWTKIEGFLKKDLPVYDDRYIKIKWITRWGKALY